MASVIKNTDRDLRVEKGVLVMAVILIATGIGLISDGKKIQARQFKIAQHVDYKATLNPYNN